MTNFVSCGDCAALTLDDIDEIVKHRQWHADFTKKFNRTRSAAIEARDALAGLRDDVKGYGDQLESRPVTVAAEQIRVNTMPSDEELGIITEDDDEDDAPDIVGARTAEDDDAERGDDELSDDDYDDDEDVDDLAPAIGGSLYTPGTGPLT